MSTVQQTLDALADEFGIATMKFSGAADEIVVAANLLKQANGIIESEYLAKVKQVQADALSLASENLAKDYQSAEVAQGVMDRLMGTNYSGTRDGAIVIENRSAADLNGDYVVDEDEYAKAYKKQGIEKLRNQLTGNDYLRGATS